MVREEVASYEELEERVVALPPPAAGAVRVFRGQSRDYALVPSGNRRKVPRSAIWAHYSRRMIMSVQREGVYEDIEQEFQLWLVWLQALAQHYGAGSRYLDVTHDLGIAIWFAFHKSRQRKLTAVVGPPGDSEHDSTLETEWVALEPRAGPGFVYVLDLIPWNRESLPKSGELVDLARAPDLFHSPRIKVQSGCLVWADEGQDLKTHATYEFVLAGRLEGWPYREWTLEEIFPRPAEDEWYARFLSLPFLLAPAADSGGEKPHLRQSLPITLFVSSPQSAYVADIRSHFRHLLPPLIHPVLSDETVPLSGAEARLAEATPIALEAPQISAHPPVDDLSWNYEVLLSDWSDDIEAFEFEGDVSAGRVALNNALVEFGPLDHAGWFEGDSLEDSLLRAVWVLRDGDSRAAYVFLQDYPQLRIQRIGPLFLRSGPLRRLEFSGERSGGTWADIETLDTLGKAVVSSLVLLRDCSPTPKAAAYPELEADDGKGGRRMIIPVSSGAARLYRATPRDDARPWYVVRDADGEPFTTAKPNLGTLSLSTPGHRFSGFSAADVRQYIVSNLGSRE